MKHSIILLSYNRPCFIREAIGSVLAQSHDDWELIIADDNSDNPVPDILKYCADKDSRIKLIFSNIKENERKLKQRGQEQINSVLKSGMVTGDTLSYLADDDFYFPNRLKIFNWFFEQMPDVDCFYSDQLLINEKTGGASLRGTVGVTQKIACKIDMGSVMHRTKILDIVGYWENYDQSGYDKFGLKTFQVVDSLFFDKIGKAGYYFYPINLPLDVHRYHEKAYTKLIEQGKEIQGWRE